MILNLSGRDETGRRRPDFAGGVAVVLADGATWYLPRVVPRLTRTLVGSAGLDLAFEWAVGPGPDPEFHAAFEAAMQALTDHIEVEGDRDGDPEIERIHADVIAVLLTRNYSLTPEEARWLGFYGFRACGDYAGLAGVMRTYNEINADLAEAAHRLGRGLPTDGPDDRPYRVGDN